MNDQGIRASALVAVELHIKNEIEMKRLLGSEYIEPISGYILNKLLACFANYIEKGEDIPIKTFEYRIDDDTVGIKSKESLLDFLLKEDRRKDPIGNHKNIH